MTAQQKQLAEKILTVLERQKFAAWYNEGGQFDRYLTGGEDIDGRPTKNSILEDILKMFVYE
jgi:hypothetical protein